jgi:hypothetical protein
MSRHFGVFTLRKRLDMELKSKDNAHEHLRPDWQEQIEANEDKVIERLQRGGEECVLVIRSWHHQHGDPAVYVVPLAILPTGIEAALDRLHGRIAVPRTGDVDYDSWSMLQKRSYRVTQAAIEKMHATGIRVTKTCVFSIIL